jgi:hypothetical protein
MTSESLKLSDLKIIPLDSTPHEMQVFQTNTNQVVEYLRLCGPTTSFEGYSQPVEHTILNVTGKVAYPFKDYFKMGPQKFGEDWNLFSDLKVSTSNTSKVFFHVGAHRAQFIGTVFKQYDSPFPTCYITWNKPEELPEIQIETSEPTDITISYNKIWTASKTSNQILSTKRFYVPLGDRKIVFDGGFCEFVPENVHLPDD